MDILAQRKTVGYLSGFLLVNGEPATKSFVRNTAYVPQVRTVAVLVAHGSCLVLSTGVCKSDSKRMSCTLKSAPPAHQSFVALHPSLWACRSPLQLARWFDTS
jgi:hypothetical protein